MYDAWIDFAYIFRSFILFMNGFYLFLLKFENQLFARKRNFRGVKMNLSKVLKISGQTDYKLISIRL